MTNSSELACDGCGQKASAEHIATRLRRLEWATRYRPVHINTLFLGAFSPRQDKDFLYAPSGNFGGEAALLLDALGISTEGKAADVMHAEFQRAGFFLTHVLECPLDGITAGGAEATALLKKRLREVAIRIRRSLKPKRVMAVTEELTPIVEDILALDLGCSVMLDDGKPFRLDGDHGGSGAMRLREAIALSTAN
jgi:hypothetical protein